MYKDHVLSRVSQYSFKGLLFEVLTFACVMSKNTRMSAAVLLVCIIVGLQ